MNLCLFSTGGSGENGAGEGGKGREGGARGGGETLIRYQHSMEYVGYLWNQHVLIPCPF